MVTLIFLTYFRHMNENVVKACLPGTQNTLRILLMTGQISEFLKQGKLDAVNNFQTEILLEIMNN